MAKRKSALTKGESVFADVLSALGFKVIRAHKRKPQGLPCGGSVPTENIFTISLKNKGVPKMVLYNRTCVPKRTISGSLNKNTDTCGSSVESLSLSTTEQCI